MGLNWSMDMLMNPNPPMPQPTPTQPPLKLKLLVNAGSLLLSLLITLTKPPNQHSSQVQPSFYLKKFNLKAIYSINPYLYLLLSTMTFTFHFFKTSYGHRSCACL